MPLPKPTLHRPVDRLRRWCDGRRPAASARQAACRHCSVRCCCPCCSAPQQNPWQHRGSSAWSVAAPQPVFPLPMLGAHLREALQPLQPTSPPPLEQPSSDPLWLQGPPSQAQRPARKLQSSVLQPAGQAIAPASLQPLLPSVRPAPGSRQPTGPHAARRIWPRSSFAAEPAGILPWGS